METLFLVLLSLTIPTTLGADWKEDWEYEENTQSLSQIEHDLEGVPFQIKTEGFGDNIKDRFEIAFFDASGMGRLGTLIISMDGPVPEYFIGKCYQEWSPFQASLPSDVVKIWTFSKTNEPTRFTVDVNGVQILNILMADICNIGTWADAWTKDVEHISLLSSNSISMDSYRSKPDSCSKPEIAGASISPNFEIDIDMFFTISCNVGYTILGSPTVTCMSEENLTELPTCQQDEVDTDNGEEDNEDDNGEEDNEDDNRDNHQDYSHAEQHKIGVVLVASMLSALNL